MLLDLPQWASQAFLSSLATPTTTLAAASLRPIQEVNTNLGSQPRTNTQLGKKL